MKIDGRRVVVDYERGRTQKNWLPRRLGGGKGNTRRTRESKAILLARELEMEAARMASPIRDRERERSYREGSSDRHSRKRSRERDERSRDFDDRRDK